MVGKIPRHMSVFDDNFFSVPQANIPRSLFNRSHDLKTGFNGGYLIPIFVDEALPGDTFNLSMHTVCRLATPINPIMDNIHLDFFFFAVPYRLLWDNFKRMMGEQDDPDDSIDYTIPQIVSPSEGFAELELHDYFGLPTENDQSAQLSVNALPSRAYNLIWNTFFRDQNLQDSVVVDKDNGPDTYSDYVLLKRGKRHDYFTSCLPWPQKGTEVDLPLGTSAPVTGVGPVDQTPAYSSLSVYETDGSSASVFANAWRTTDDNIAIEQDPSNAGYPNIRVDLSEATASTINELREAFQLQKLMERDARAGTRYIEWVLSHFGVSSPDSRMQRPEYLGGGRTIMDFQGVAQTIDVTGTNVLGRLGAFGVQRSSGIGFTKGFTEHCIVIGMCCAYADLTYQQGVDRMWLRNSREDHYIPALAHLGEQEVTNIEIFWSGDSNDDDVFGYQERWAEYRFKKSLITGPMRSTYGSTLDPWHLSQEFASLPTLGDTFIQENPPFDRVIAVADEIHFLMDVWFDYKCARPMPVRSVPGMIDHF